MNIEDHVPFRMIFTRCCFYRRCICIYSPHRPDTSAVACVTSHFIHITLFSRRSRQIPQSAFSIINKFERSKQEYILCTLFTDKQKYCQGEYECIPCRHRPKQLHLSQHGKKTKRLRNENSLLKK